MTAYAKDEGSLYEDLSLLKGAVLYGGGGKVSRKRLVG
jgi:hypothetical protein